MLASSRNSATAAWITESCSTIVAICFLLRFFADANAFHPVWSSETGWTI
jgi:hypothetical protein